MGPISIARAKQCHPVFLPKLITLETQFSGRIILGVTQGLRTDPEQLALWSQGRLGLSEVNALRAAVNWAPLTDAQNDVVTDAKPGYSWHCFGLAVDVVPENIDTGAPDWNKTHPIWIEIVQRGEVLGMVSGISWKDEPHFQITGRFPVTPTDEVRMLYQSGGIAAVWAASGIAA